MKEDRLDDVLGDSHAQELADVERRLSALEPTAVNLDTTAILRKATLPAERSAATQATSPSWLSLGASWTCGALAGALVTFVVLSRSIGPAEQQSAPSASTVRNETPAVDAVVVDHVAEPTQPLWSRSELLVSTQLRQLNDRPSFEQTQLRAGSYANLTTRPYFDPPAAPVDSADGLRWEPAADGRSPSINAPTPSSRLDCDRLLQELLGDVPNTVL